MAAGQPRRPARVWRSSSWSVATTINGEVPSTDDLNRYLDRFIQEHGEPTIEDIETILDGFSGVPVTKGLCDHVGFTLAAREDRN